MATNDESVLEDDFSDGLVDDLNNFYAESVNYDTNRPTIDDALTRHFDQFVSPSRREAATRDSSREGALSSFIDSSRDDYLENRPGPAGLSPNLARLEEAKLLSQRRDAQSRQEPGPLRNHEPLSASLSQQHRPSGAFYAHPKRLAGRDGVEPSDARLRISPSFYKGLSPYSAFTYPPRREPMLSGFRASDQPQAVSAGSHSHEKELVADSELYLPPGSSDRSAVASVQNPPHRDEAQSRPTAAASGSLSAEKLDKPAEPSSPTMNEPPVLSSSAGSSDSAQRQSGATDPPEEQAKGRAHSRANWLLPVLVLLVAFVPVLFFWRQGVQARETAAALEAKVWLLETQIINHVARESELSKLISTTLAASVPEATTPPEPTNLALISKGAHILKGYTTPPSGSSWWRWSQSFRADPDCMLRPPSAACWPIHGEAALGIGLGQRANLSEVRLHLATVSEPYNFDVYSLAGSSDFRRLKHRVSDQGFVLCDASDVTQIVMRLSDLGDLCIRSVELVGTVL